MITILPTRKPRRFKNRYHLVVIGWLACLPGAILLAQEPGTLAQAPTWQPPLAKEVRAEALAWLDAQQPDASVRARAEELWSIQSDEPSSAEPLGTELLDRLARTFALTDENARRLVALCDGPRQEPIVPAHAWLSDPKTPPLVANNLRLLYGRWLARERLFDESQLQLAGLYPTDVVDPASLLFYQAVVHHRLLDRRASLQAIGQLLDGAQASPPRYVAVARLMKTDLARLEEDTLDHIARRMEDVGRRLELGRAGDKVRQIEGGVIESLDKLIEEIQQQQQQQQQASAGGNNLQPGSPAQDSRLLGGKGAGEVTKKDIGDTSGWGNLSPKQREEALQEIGREFPSHYRDAIEQYFRKLASRRSEGE